MRLGFLALAASVGVLASVAASPAAAVATGTIAYTQPTGSVSSTDSIAVHFTVNLDQGSDAITTDAFGNVTSGVTDADLAAAGIDKNQVAFSDINVYFSCTGTFTASCTNGPPYDFSFASGAGSLSGPLSLEIDPGTSTDFLFGTFAPTGGIAPYGTYTFFDAGVFAQYFDAQNNHLGDVAFFNTCGSQTVDCAFRRTVDSGPVAAGVPEPTSWALMLAGFGLAGAAMRSRRRAALAI